MRNLLETTCLLIVLLSLPALTAAQGANDAGGPCSSEEHRQFDFWIGDWTVRSADGQVVGTNRIESILNGCALAENWQGASGATGKSLNMFYTRGGHWHQSWVDNSGTRLDLEGGWKKGKMVLSGTMPGADGKPVLHEISWEPKPDGTVVQSWRGSKNKGREWRQLFVGVYSKTTSD